MVHKFVGSRFPAYYSSSMNVGTYLNDWEPVASMHVRDNTVRTVLDERRWRRSIARRMYVRSSGT